MARQLRIGVLALQGDFREHVEVLRRLEIEAVEVRMPRDLEGVAGLIIPGGESTTISTLMERFRLTESLRALSRQGGAVWGTCAGMIVIAREATDLAWKPLGLIDIVVRRNAFGRQVDSFEEDLPVPALGPRPFHAVFIRAPLIGRTAPEVEVLACLSDGTPVAARQRQALVTAFHPELTDDLRFHSLFLRMAAGEAGG